MAKKVEGYIKLQIAAGNATPAPPVGPALGQKSVNIMDFCKQFNARTQDQPGMIIPFMLTDHSHLLQRHRRQQFFLRKLQDLMLHPENLTRRRLQH